MTHAWDHAIQRAYDDPRFWDILLNESVAQAGPFDGACLICAQALLRAAGTGELVRLASHTWAAEHYGAEIDGVIYDFGGGCASADQWLRRFQEEEHVARTLSFARGYMPNVGDAEATPIDERASKKIADLLQSYRLAENTWSAPGLG